MLSSGSQFGELESILDYIYIPHRLSASVFSDGAHGTENEEGSSMPVNTKL